MSRRTLALGLTMVVAGCTATPAASQPGGTAAAQSTTPSAIGASSPTARVISMNGERLEDCGLRDGSGTIRALCGELVVPEDRTIPNGRTISLSVAVIPTSSATPAGDPLFVLAGGPGGAARTQIWTARMFTGTHATRDVVLVDQRGTGGSNELRFGNPPDVTGLPAAEVERARKAWITEQLKAFDADPRMYTTAPAMDDIDAVRAALGYDRINLYGASYGATAAQYYIRQHADHLRSVILDGATLIDVPVMELIAPNSQRALDLLFARCTRDPACHAAYPTLQADFKQAVATLAKGPVTTDVISRVSTRKIVVDSATFAGAIHQGLLSSDATAGAPWFIHAAATGRWNDVAAVIQQGEQSPEGLQLMSGMIRCSEAWAVFDPSQVAKLGATSYLRDVEVALATEQAGSCALAQKALVPANDATRAATSVPVLLVVGNADPQDPPSNIATASTDFPNSLTVVVPDQGHTVAHLGCMPTIVDAFIAAGTVKGLDTSCVATGVAPPPFRLR